MVAEHMERALKVLIVEDCEDDYILLKAHLEEAGYALIEQNVASARGLEEALNAREWDIVLSDHNMPGFSAIAVLDIVRGQESDLPVIIVSGSMPDATAVEAMRLGARDFIEKGKLSRLVPAIEREISEQCVRRDLRAMEARAQWLMHYDALTGLPNRDYLFGYLRNLIQRAPHLGFGVLVLDINRFRNVTRSLGLLAGNEVLSVLADRLREEFESNAMGFVARLVADRFVIVCQGSQAQDSLQVVFNRLRALLEPPVLVGGRELFVHVSVGACLYPAHAQSAHQLLQLAETALYCAKEEGPGRYRIYDPAMSASSEERLALESALHHAIRQKEFELHYQPQIDLGSGKLIGAEALVRWNHPQLGMVSPARFVPLLEETGLIVPVGEWILRTACEEAQRWHTAGHRDLRVAVNLSAIQFQQAELVTVVARVLEETGLPPSALELEITENIAMHNEEFVIATLAQIGALGVHIAIDDFGSGYSSLSYLKRLPVHKLKIDQSFVRELEEAGRDAAIVLAIVALGRSLEMRVIAEGVETAEQAKFLQQNGCEEGQGYYFDRPLPAARFFERLEK
ncbi:MAG: EAL domain-containing protein [Halothiobacillaceae bacterium]|nr:EAL domain-containing protein [Halothiobacillaceae bacterium]